MQRISQVWPGWHADELIGQGSYGRVYRASRSLGGHTSVAAIKVVDVPRDGSEAEALRSMGMDEASVRAYFGDAARRVVDEVAAMDALKGSPHVVHVEDYQLLEQGDGIGWTVLIRMELLEPLDAHQRSHGLPDARETARIGADVCDALAACHAAGMIHRDVKPANVFRGPYGDYKLGDFGIARRLGEAAGTTKTYAGTDAFMAPEVPGGHYDESVDTYSLGVMLYRWLNGGRPPFLPAEGVVSQEDLMRAQARRLSGERPPLPSAAGADPGLAAIVAKACEPSPADRWVSAAEFGAALRGGLNEHPAPADTEAPCPEPVGTMETDPVPADTTEAGPDLPTDVPALDPIEGTVNLGGWMGDSRGGRANAPEIADMAERAAEGVRDEADIDLPGDPTSAQPAPQPKRPQEPVQPVQPVEPVAPVQPVTQTGDAPRPNIGQTETRPLWKTVLLTIAVVFGFFMLALFTTIMFGYVISFFVTGAAIIWYLVSVFRQSR